MSQTNTSLDDRLIHGRSLLTVGERKFSTLLVFLLGFAPGITSSVK